MDPFFHDLSFEEGRVVLEEIKSEIRKKQNEICKFRRFGVANVPERHKTVSVIRKDVNLERDAYLNKMIGDSLLIEYYKEGPEPQGPITYHVSW
jgi:hypothetical protein